MAEYYEKINWQNGSEGGTPLSAENLNKMEEGISGAEMRTGPLEYDRDSDTFSAGDKIQLDTNGNLKVSGTITDGNNNVLGTSISVDNEISDTSENPVQNKVIKSYIDDITGDIDTTLEEIITLQELYIRENAPDIKFWINDIECTAKENDTWEDFFSIQENVDKVGYENRNDGLVRVYGGVFWITYIDGTPVKHSDVITSEYVYQTTNE